MLSFYLLLFTVKIAGTVMCAIYCWRIARLNMTPTFTYILFFIAFALRVVTQIKAAFFYRDIVAIWGGIAVHRILESQTLETVIIASFLIGFARTYYRIRSLPIAAPKS